jgi:hypothetical protein
MGMNCKRFVGTKEQRKSFNPNSKKTLLADVAQV